MTTINLWAGQSIEFTAELVGEVTVAGKTLPAEMIAHLFAFGMRQCIKDAAAGEKEDDKRNSACMKKLDALIAGTLREGIGGARLAPEEKAAKAIAFRRVQAAVITSGKSMTIKAMEELADKLFTRDRNQLIKAAKIELAATPSVDLTELV